MSSPLLLRLLIHLAILLHPMVSRSVQSELVDLLISRGCLSRVLELVVVLWWLIDFISFSLWKITVQGRSSFLLRYRS